MDAEKMAREIVKGLGFAFDKAGGRRFVDEAIAEGDIVTALREARNEGMLEAAAMLWDDLPEMTRKHLGKRGKREKVLRLEIRDEIERAAKGDG